MTATVILRMQGLDAAASTQDIRKFFASLHIPDGGVCVVGGRLSEAFIAFTTERDAQLAMRFTGTSLKGSKVTLHISSMAELEHKLKSLLKKKSKSSPKQPRGIRPQSSPVKSGPSSNAQLHGHKPGDLPSPANPPQPLYPNTASPGTPPAESLYSSTAFLLGVCTVLQGLQSGLKQNQTPPSDELKTPEPTLNSRPGFIRIFGLPVSATKDDICHFFKGLSVKEAITNVELGLGHGCIVQFATMQDACDALQYNNRSLGSDSVEVRTATEKMWTSALQECKNADHREKEKPHSCGETVSHMQQGTGALQLKRQAVNQLPYKVPKKLKTPFSPPTEQIVMVRNLPKKMTKTEIKELFRCPLIARKNVLHLLDNNGNRTDTAFLIFNCTEDYDYAMNLSGCHLGPATIEVSAVTKEIMRSMLSKTQPSHIMNSHKKGRKENHIKLMHQKHKQRWM